VFGSGVAFALLIFGSVDTALGANGMGSFDGNNGKKVDGNTGFSDADGGHESGQTSANDDDLRLSHLE
jgi:hypothetical protein